VSEELAVLREDNKKMQQALQTLLDWKERTLLAPSTMATAPAKGFMEGSNAAFKHVSSLAQFTLESLTMDYNSKGE
jgi:hypothetical protein